MHEPHSLDGQLAIVTGGARGIGLAIAHHLSLCGAEVHIFDKVATGEYDYTRHEVDIVNPKSIETALGELPRPASLLVNNAGITRDRTLVKMSDAEWQEVIDVNLTGAFNMIRAVSPAMSTAGFGRIVNVTSINGLRGKFGQANYTAAKAGLIGLTKTAARELGRKHITVNAVAPGMVLTEMALAAPEEARAVALEETVLKHLAEPIDVAYAVGFLLSNAARMITGQVLQVDAGQYL